MCHKDPKYLSNKELVDMFEQLLILHRSLVFDNYHKEAINKLERSIELKEEILRRLNEVWRNVKMNEVWRNVKMEKRNDDKED